jgi:nucleotide-binding universal stress UspA family protein
MKILLTHDGSAMADVAVPAVQALAQLIGADAEITALCIIPTNAADGSDEALEAEASLDRISRVLGPHAVARMIRRGAPGPLVVETAEELGCDLIAMSTAGMSGEKRFLGSVADHVARGSRHVPVMLCRPMPAGTKHFQKLLLPLDGSAMNASALAWTDHLASVTGAEVVLVRSVDTLEQLRSMTTPAGYALGPYLVDDATATRILTAEKEQAQRELEATANQLRASSDLGVRTEVVAGVPGETIVRANETLGCDVVVLSPRGRGAGAQLLGSVADHILQHVGEATVIIVPPSDGAAA